jgi:hypothetical protein
VEIKLSKPDQFIDKKVEMAATQAGCWPVIKWWMPEGCRFVLVDKAMSKKPASFQQHDDVIARLFMHDPHALVRTAKAVYKGAAAFMGRERDAP